MLLDLAAWLFNDCISILRHLTGTLSGPAFVPLQYQNVLVSWPQPRPLLSCADMTRKGAAVDAVIAVGCLTRRLACFLMG